MVEIHQYILNILLPLGVKNMKNIYFEKDSNLNDIEINKKYLSNISDLFTEVQDSVFSIIPNNKNKKHTLYELVLIYTEILESNKITDKNLIIQLEKNLKKLKIISSIFMGVELDFFILKKDLISLDEKYHLENK